MKIEENLKAAILIAIIVAVISITPIASASDWEQFQKDNINTGYTTDSAPVSDPELAWWKQTSGTGMGGIDVTPIVADGAAYVLDYQGILWSFDATIGTENWNTDLTEGSGTFELSTPAYNNGIVYAAVSSGSEGQGAGRVCAVYTNGTIRECEYYGLDTFQLNTPITYADGKIYLGNSKYGTKDNSTYYCIDASDVTNEIWNRTAPYCTGYYWAGAAIVGDYIIYGDDNGNLTCLNKDTGVFVDSLDVTDEKIKSSIVWNEVYNRIYLYNRIYFTSTGGYAFALGFNSQTGHFIPDDHWNTSIGYSTSTPAVYDGRLYVGCGSFGSTGKVYCLSESDGSVVWSTPNLGGVQSSPALSVVNGRKFIYFTINDYNGSAYCLEDTDSTYTTQWVWNPPEPDNQYIMQGLAISDGHVYFGTDYGRVYALKEGQEQFEIPIYSGKNLIAIPLIQDDTSLGAVFEDIAAAGDVVRRYVNSEGRYHSAEYFTGYGWYEYEPVEPIEPEVGYVYERAGADCTLTLNGTRLCLSMVDTPIFNGMNLIGYLNFTPTDLSTFSSPVNGDAVRRYVNSEEKYHSAEYFDGYGWYEYEVVNPIEVGVGYYYERVGSDYVWTYEV
jgi:outer membrane protein assembly factor BamB